MGNFRPETGKWISITILGIVGLMVLSGCHNRRDASVSEKPRKKEEVRIWSIGDQPVLEVKRVYRGKRPGQLHFGKISPSHDWEKVDTDFYSCALRNLTDRPIRLVDVRIKLERGIHNSKGESLGADYLRERWGEVIIKPNETIERVNNWVWGKGNWNNLIKDYRAELQPGEMTSGSSPFAPLFADSEGKAVPFSFRIILPYRR